MWKMWPAWDHSLQLAQQLLQQPQLLLLPSWSEVLPQGQAMKYWQAVLYPVCVEDLLATKI